MAARDGGGDAGTDVLDRFGDELHPLDLMNEVDGDGDGGGDGPLNGSELALMFNNSDRDLVTDPAGSEDPDTVALNIATTSATPEAISADTSMPGGEQPKRKSLGANVDPNPHLRRKHSVEEWTEWAAVTNPKRGDREPRRRRHSGDGNSGWANDLLDIHDSERAPSTDGLGMGTLFAPEHTAGFGDKPVHSRRRCSSDSKLSRWTFDGLDNDGNELANEEAAYVIATSALYAEPVTSTNGARSEKAVRRRSAGANASIWAFDDMSVGGDGDGDDFDGIEETLSEQQSQQNSPVMDLSRRRRHSESRLSRWYADDEFTAEQQEEPGMVQSRGVQQPQRRFSETDLSDWAFSNDEFGDVGTLSDAEFPPFSSGIPTRKTNGPWAFRSVSPGEGSSYKISQMKSHIDMLRPENVAADTSSTAAAPQADHVTSEAGSHAPSTPQIDPLLSMEERLKNLMALSQESLKHLQQYDKSQGLPASHCATMVKSSRSRRQLIEGKILKKWDGTPLLQFGEDGSVVTGTKKRSAKKKGAERDQGLGQESAASPKKESV